METPGSAIDKLITVVIKLYNEENIKRDPNASDKTIADATRATNKLNKYRNDLIRELDEFFGFENAISIKKYGK